MSSSSQHILSEYLVALGFKVDETAGRKVDNTLWRKQVNVDRLAKTVLAAGTAVTAFTVLWARSMERMYYSSRRAETTVETMKGFGFGAKMIGMSSEQMAAAIEGMARAMRLNPGLQGLIEQFGIKVTGRQKADVMMDFLKALKSMPFYVSSQYAGLFGIGPDDLLHMLEGLDLLEKAKRERAEIAELAGVNADEAARAALEYARELTQIQELFGILKDVAAINLLPMFKAISGITKEVLKDWTTILKRITPANGGIGGFFRDLGIGLGILPAGSGATSKSPGGVQIAPGSISAERLAAANALPDPFKRRPGESAAATMARLERENGLPAGLLDKIWAKESSRGRHMLSPAGAKGHFGFMDPTAREMGVKDPNDFNSSADGAARYMRQLLNRYNGDLQKALAAYNWGMGNVDRKGLGRAPAETIDYVSSISGRPLTIQSDSQITVVAADPMAAGRAVAREQNGVNAELVRNAEGVLR